MRRVVGVLFVVAVVVVVALAWWRPWAVDPEPVRRPSSPVVRRTPRLSPLPGVLPVGASDGTVRGTLVDAAGRGVPGTLSFARVTDAGPQTGDLVPCASPDERRARDVVRGRVTSEVVATVDAPESGTFSLAVRGDGPFVAWAEGPAGRSESRRIERVDGGLDLGAFVLRPLRSVSVRVYPPVAGTLLLFDDAGVFGEVAFEAGGEAKVGGVPSSGIGFVATAGDDVSWIETPAPGDERLNLSLAQRLPLEVRVTKGRDRVPDAEVQVVVEGEEPCRAWSDASGVAHFPPLAIHEARVEATLGKAYDARVLLWTWAGEPVDLYLDDRPAITVQVGDDAGAPLEGIAVSLSGAPVGRTDAAGTFELRGWRGGDSVSVSGDAYERAYVELPYEPAPVLPFTLHRFLPVTCRVRVPEGVDPAALRLEVMGSPSEGVPVGVGEYRFDDVPRGPASCDVTSEVDVYGGSGEFEHPLTPGGSVVDVELARAPGVLELRVVDAAGAVQPGLEVVAAPGDGIEPGPATRYRRRMTDASGAVRLANLALGPWEVRAERPFDGEASIVLASAVVEVAGSSVVRHTLVVAPLGRLVGRVLDRAGEPVPDARVFASWEQGSRSAEADAEGRFALEVVDGQRLEVEAIHGRRKSPVLETRAGSGSLELVLDDALRVSGRILLADGGVPREPFVEGQAITSKDGTFDVELEPGTESLTFTAADVVPLVVDLPAPVARAGGSVGELRFDATRRVVVTATDPSGRPLADVLVRLLGVPSPMSWRTDAQGIAVAEGVPTGGLRMRCERPDRSESPFLVPEGRREATCVLGGPGTVEVALAPGVSFPFPVKVSLEPFSGGSFSATLSGGASVAVQVPSGRYLVTATDPEGDEIGPMESVEVTAGGRVRVLLRAFPEGGVVRAQLGDRGGMAVILLGGGDVPETVQQLFALAATLRMQSNGEFRNIPRGPARLLACKPDREASLEDMTASCLVQPFDAPGHGTYEVVIGPDARAVTLRDASDRD